MKLYTSPCHIYTYNSPGLKTRPCNVLYYIAETLLASNKYKHSMLRDHICTGNTNYTGKKQ